MRILSLFTAIEESFKIITDSSMKWNRSVNYAKGDGTMWNKYHDCILEIHLAKIGEDGYSVQAKWKSFAGEQFGEKVYFCGRTRMDWQTCAESLAENLSVITK